MSLLAVIGESSMEEHSQAMTSSWTCVLPRIIPAPQALLKADRPTRLPQVNAAVVGVHNGTLVPTLNYFPNIIHPIEELPAFAFKVLRISHRREWGKKSQNQENAQSGSKHTSFSNSVELNNIETGQQPGIRRRSTMDKLRSLSVQSHDKPKPRIPSRKSSPLNILAVLSFLLTFGLLGWAISVHDGVACLALATISIASSIIGYASWWSPVLMNRSTTANVNVPDGDVVIRTREGAFLIVKCNEDVARDFILAQKNASITLKTGRTEPWLESVPFCLWFQLSSLGTVILPCRLPLVSPM